LSFQFAIALFFGAFLGAYFSGATLLYFALLFGFIWPRVYHEKQEQIDLYAGKVRDQAVLIKSQVVEKLPPNIKDKIQ